MMKFKFSAYIFYRKIISWIILCVLLLSCFLHLYTIFKPVEAQAAAPKLVKYIPLAFAPSDTEGGWEALTTTTSTSYVIPGVSNIISWDATKYDGTITAYFEAVIRVDDASGTAYAALTLGGGTTAITGSEVSTQATSYTRVRSGDIYGNLVNNTPTNYECIFKTTAGRTATLVSARLVIMQSGTITKTETYIPFAYPARTRALTSYGTPQDGYGNLIPAYSLWTAANWSDVANVYFEANVKSSSGSYAAYAALYDTAGTPAIVANSEVSTVATAKTRLRSSALTLTDGTAYQLYGKVSGGTGTYVGGFLIVQQSGTITATETHMCVGPTRHSINGNHDDSANYLWSLSEWSALTKTVYSESTMAVSPNAYTGVMHSLDSITEVTTDSESGTTYIRHRSASWIPTDGNVIDLRFHAATAGAHLYHAGDKIIIVVTLISPPAQVTNLHHTTNTTSSISWDWDDTLDATGYKVYRASDNVELADVGVSNWDQGSLSSNFQSTVYVKAYNDAGEGTVSANAQAYTSANPPSFPGHSGNTTTGITWTWNVNSNPAGTQFYASDSTGNSDWSADATSWNASSGHSVNTQYTVSVKARNGDNDETSIVTAQAYTSIESVTGATFSSVTTDSIDVTGTGTISNLSSGSSGIYFRESETGTNSGWLTTNTWARDSLMPDTQYHFYITTRNGDGEANTEQGPYDKYTLAAPAAGVLAIPGWSSDPTIGNSIAISWNILSATSVRIRCLNTGTDIYTGAWSPYVHSLLLANTLYTYRIYSINGEGVENTSYVQVSATAPPDQPQNLVLIGQATQNTATVSWSQVPGATGYVISYGTDQLATNLGTITLAGQTNTTYIFQNLQTDTRYYFKVRAATGSVLGAWSELYSFQTSSLSLEELPETGANHKVNITIAFVITFFIFITGLFFKLKYKTGSSGVH